MRPDKRYMVRVTTVLGVVHSEGHTDCLDGANAYARQAILDGCPAAAVVPAAGGSPIAQWTPERVARESAPAVG